MKTLPKELNEALDHRSHEADGCVSRVWYSPCGDYRYGLARTWDVDRPSVLFLMLNPSTADEFRNDPTVARCETRARTMGFGTMLVANIFAFRATHPSDLKAADAPIGPLNDSVLVAWSSAASMTVAAWGVHGAHRGRAKELAAHLPDTTYHLGLTKAGHPRHPLYVAFATQPRLWRLEERYGPVPS